MFERIKAYKTLKKSEKFLEGCKIIAETTGNKALLNEVDESIRLNEKLRRCMWRNRAMAKEYNIETAKINF